MPDPVQREKALANFMAPGELHLCIDSQVMLIKNTDDNLVNGSMGRVVGFCDPAAFRGVKINEKGEEEIDRIEEIFDLSTKEGKRAAERRAKLQIEECPVVGFKVPGANTTQYECVQRELFKNELPNGEVQISRSQVCTVRLLPHRLERLLIALTSMLVPSNPRVGNVHP